MTENAFILNFFRLYNMIWKMGLPFLKKNKRLKTEFHKRITCSHLSKADIWIQAASAGEAFLAVCILKHLSPKTSLKVLITSTTSQGMDILKTELTSKTISPLIDLKIEWFPFDMPHTVKQAVKTINPGVMVLLETEIWPGLLFYLKENQTKILILNARLSKKSFQNYLKTKFLWKHLAPDMILATSDQDAKRYEQVFETATIKTMSNIKFEAIETPAPHAVDRLEQIKKILPPLLPLTILASVRRQEEKEILFILEEILSAFPNQVVAVFPRHMHRIESWKKKLTSKHMHFYLKSGITAPLQGPGIILWDTFGELKAAYGLASVVFVGGSLKPLGGQNFIEPAIQGAVTIIGPYNDDFTWASDIFTKGLVIKKENWKEISKTLVAALKEPADRSERKSQVLEYIRSNQGGTEQACDEILKAMKS